MLLLTILLEQLSVADFYGSGEYAYYIEFDTCMVLVGFLRFVVYNAIETSCTFWLTRSFSNVKLVTNDACRKMTESRRKFTVKDRGNK